MKYHNRKSITDRVVLPEGAELLNKRNHGPGYDTDYVKNLKADLAQREKDKHARRITSENFLVREVFEQLHVHGPATVEGLSRKFMVPDAVIRKVGKYLLREALITRNINKRGNEYYQVL
jgi:hypothetical protein